MAFVFRTVCTVMIMKNNGEKCIYLFLRSCLLLLILNMIPCCGQEDAKTIFEKAKNLYEQGDYQQSHELFNSLSQSTAQAALWCNKGNCSYHLGNYVRALAEWEHAIAMGIPPRMYHCITHNKGQAYAALGAREEISRSTGQPSFSAIQQSLDYIVHTTPFLFLGLQLFSLISWGALLYFFWRRFRLWRLAWLFIPFFFMILYGIYLRIQPTHNALVVRNSSILAGPSEHYHVLRSVVPAEKIEIQDRKDGWCKIRYNGIVGWIPENSVYTI